MLYEIAIKSPLRRLFTYESDQKLQKGSRVRVPFRSSEKVGFVWSEATERPKGLKSVIGAIDEQPLYDSLNLKFYDLASRYYGISVGELLHASLPKKLRDGGEIPEPIKKEFSLELPPLSDEQKVAFEGIREVQGFSSQLLFGETGSGKTEVYLHLMKEVLEKGGQVLFLVPEISLTPQLEDRLAERLGVEASIFHSSLKDSIRLKSFSNALSGNADVFLGARSALFLPYRNLKLIIVDEEHDSSYKQSERGTYNARDLALLRAKLSNIPIVLGSATPSLETYQRSLDGQQKMYRLKKFFDAKAAEFELVDLKKTWKEEEKSFISNVLHESIEETLLKKEQVLLFLNRRGSASQRHCIGCGDVESCQQCSAHLTLHFDIHKAICHLCGFQKPISKTCVACGHDEFFDGGIGTKEVEEQVKQRFPEARVARLDRDQTQKRNFLGETLRDFANEKIDILVGTQMISKGIDIGKLSTLGIILADLGWGVPDFRAQEKSFQLLHQLMGRVGRRGQDSRVIIQSFFVDHPLFSFLREKEKGFETFAESELEIRKMAHLPPFSRFLLIHLSDRDLNRLTAESNDLERRMSKLAKALKIEMFGPVPAPISRWKGQWRYQILAKSQESASLGAFLTTVLDELEKAPLKVKVKLDRDPFQFM